MEKKLEQFVVYELAVLITERYPILAACDAVDAARDIYHLIDWDNEVLMHKGLSWIVDYYDKQHYFDTIL